MWGSVVLPGLCVMTRSSEPWTTRPHPTSWENTVTGRGFILDPQETIAAGFAWAAVLIVGAAAVVAGGMLGVAKWISGHDETGD